MDLLLIGANEPYYTPNEAELGYVRHCWESCSAFMTVCGGIQVPICAGILDGRTVTGPRFYLGQLREEAPTTTWLEKRWVRDGKLWTSGALLNGLDMMGAFIRETWGYDGHPSAELVELMLGFGSNLHRDIDYQDEPRAE